MPFKCISVSALIVVLAFANVALGTPIPNHLNGAPNDAHFAASSHESMGLAQHQERSLGLVARHQDAGSKAKEADAGAAKQANGQVANKDNNKENGADQNRSATRYIAAPGSNQMSIPVAPAGYNLFAQSINQLGTQNGYFLSDVLLERTLIDFPEDFLSTIIILFRLLAEFYPTQLASWVPSVIERLPPKVATMPDKERFLLAFKQ
ncbi:hypothetical protein PTTG_09515 [Puccinia triticina 1-1 BBBD Race 1]|uniref:Uncharacterized protein n=1 Tax=Puccinia triticina (isolate 1-1 / race 1 (BBBD)) TaxID=630390 RepID=A0A180GAA3_PUCT1|nr:hypothetical protein PTTG_09515 [Puccinia triticina 1-1 BBBD Race 1]